jgi:DoxX-like family
MMSGSPPVKGRFQSVERSHTVFIALSVLLAAVCLVPAAAKLRSHPKMLASASHFGIPWTRYRLIGVAELGAAAGVLAGLSWISLGVAAASGMALLLIGALAVHRRAGDALKHAAPALVALAISLAYLATALIR